MRAAGPGCGSAALSGSGLTASWKYDTRCYTPPFFPGSMLQKNITASEYGIYNIIYIYMYVTIFEKTDHSTQTLDFQLRVRHTSK